MLTIRPAEAEDAAAIANVHVKTWRAAYAGLLPTAHLRALTVESRSITWARLLKNQDDELVILVSENDDANIVGFVSGGPVRSVVPGHDLEISALYVLPGFQRNGHGRRLFMAASNRLSKLDGAGLVVWMLKDNPAAGFYKRLGGTVVSSRTIRFAGSDVDEIAYGWAEVPSYD